MIGNTHFNVGGLAKKLCKPFRLVSDIRPFNVQSDLRNQGFVSNPRKISGFTKPNIFKVSTLKKQLSLQQISERD